MEVRVYYEDGCIESHRVPEFVGNSSTAVQEGVGSETHNLIDDVSHVVERFWHTKEGYWLGYSTDGVGSYQVDGEGGVRTSNGSKRKPILVVAENMLSFVTMILVDGEKVYPKTNTIEPDFGMPF